MLRRLLVFAAVMAALMAFPTAASAGGWWSVIDLESNYLVVGRVIHAETTQVSFFSIDEAERARRGHRFFAYLVQGYDFSSLDKAMAEPESARWWNLGNARTILLGEVKLGGWYSGLATGAATFTVPDIELGTYALMFCTAGCTEPLGEIVPSRVTLITDPESARLARDLNRVDERVGGLAESLKARTEEAMNDARYARLQAADAVAAARKLHSTIDVLRADLRGVTAELDDRGSPMPWLAIAGWFIAGAAMALLVVLVLARRRRPPTRFDDQELERLMRRESELIAR